MPVSKLVFEKRVLLCMTLLCTFGFLLWLIALSTNYWYIVEATDGVLVNTTGRYFLRSNAGLWMSCRQTFANETGAAIIIKQCKYYALYPTKKQLLKNPRIDETILDYRRTNMAFSIITLVVMVLGIYFSLYSIKHPRYMYKRLAGGVHFISAAGVVVMVEVLVSSVHYAREHLPAAIPKRAAWYYGYSFALAWVTFITFALAGITFLMYSGKKKGSKAPTDELAMEDQPTIIAR